jgi:hypothetical protein
MSTKDKGPNLPSIRVKPLGKVDIEDVLLAEFSDAPVREIIDVQDPGKFTSTEAKLRQEKERADFPQGHVAGQKAVIKGLRIVRVIHPRNGVVAVIDPGTNELSLDFMAGRNSDVVFASVRPTRPYCWQLLSCAPKEKEGAKILMATGSRVATTSEEATLDAMFPFWKARCEEFDAQFSQGSQRTLAIAPPLISWPKKVEQASPLLPGGDVEDEN